MKKGIKIVPVGATYVWDHLIEDFDVNMVDEDYAVYYLKGFTVEQVVKWIKEVTDGERAAAFFYLEVSDAAE